MGWREDLDRFRGLVEKEYSPEKIILFGSRARGDEFTDSDVDLLIVSEKFENMSFRERMIKMQFLWEGDELLEALCYTPDEFEKKKWLFGIVIKGVEEGIAI